MALTLVAGLVAGCRAGAGDPDRQPLLDRQAILERQTWRDNRDWDWYRRQIPFFESPDPDIDATYYYRWELLTKHLTYGAPETGYTFTEFIDRPFWSGAYGAISCPLGHQLYEARWLADRRIAEDFARYWFEVPGAEPRSYSNWYGDAVWASYLVTGDSAFLRRVLPHLVTQYRGWLAERWDSTHRMFKWDGMHDGMETNINSRQTTDSFAGAEGYRPTLNSYLFADARAIAKTAALLGDSALSREYAARAADLKARVQKELWDPSRQFFLHQFARDEASGVRAGTRTYQTGRFAGDPHGRELIGYVPWQFSLPDSGFEAAWRFVADSQYFDAPFGPTTVERGDPQFLVSDVCCVWSGNAWPYATAQTLVAMANLLNGYRQDVVSAADYQRLFRRYTLDQRKAGRPYIAEAANPFTGSWEGHDTYYHSEHYFHSGYVDLVITGLVGLRPRADDSLEVNPLTPEEWPWFALEDVRYHGRMVSIVWDRDGTRYRRGAGLSLWVDGRKLAGIPRRGRLVVHLGPTPALPAVDRPVNFAVNNGRGAFPSVSASSSDPASPPHYLVDGHVWYHQSPPNRWTSGGGNAADTVVVDFGVARPVESVALYFLDDGSEVRPPASYSLERWEGGTWIEIPGQRTPAEPAGRQANWVRFDRIETARFRLVVAHRPGARTGLSEIEAWAHALPPFPPPTAPSANVAMASPERPLPRVTASFSAPGDEPSHAADGRIGYSRYSRNRWSARGTANRADWLDVDFGVVRRVGRIEVHFVADGRGLETPLGFTAQAREGDAWVPVTIRRRLPERPLGSAVNTLWIDPIETSRIRLTFEHARPAATAVSELLVWEVTP